MSSTQRFRVIAVTCGMAVLLSLFGYGVYRTYRTEPFMIAAAVIAAIWLITAAVLTVRRAGKH